MERKLVWMNLLILSLAVITPACDAQFFDFMANAMRFMGRMLGMDPVPETRADAEPSRTAERIKALHDAAKFVTEAREKAGKRVLKNRMERMQKSIGTGGSGSSSSSDLDTDTATLSDDTSNLLSDTASATDADLDTSLASLLGDSETKTETDTSDLEALLKTVQARSSNRRKLNVVLARIVSERLKRQRQLQRRLARWSQSH